MTRIICDTKIYGWWIITPFVTIISFILMSLAFGVSKGSALIDPKNTLRRWWIMRPCTNVCVAESRRTIQKEGVLKMFKLFADTGFAGVILMLASLWVGASVLTSGIKVFKDDCGATYKIEAVVGGDWFCPEE